ncbi:MAG: ribonuclease III [Proteobacteria bacterium]|nr:ribonuclease III [Pseudomonadota bacterium]
MREFEEKLGYVFRDRSLLESALTHPSYDFEHGAHKKDNQRLEFLGDAILDFVIADILFRHHPDYQEGELSRIRSRLVCEAALCILARELDFEDHILMGKGEVQVSGMMRPGTLADAYEAVIGAIYLDGGIEPARAFVTRFHKAFLADPDGDWLPRDAKTRLQELAQAEHLDIRYEVIGETGPTHAPTFEVAVFLGGKAAGSGCGRNKKEAQQAAAEDALDRWQA